jgi:hypothetical protein
MSSAPHIAHKPTPDAASQHELDALRRIYARAIQRYQEKKGGPDTAPNDREGFKDDPATPKVPR